MFCSCSLYHTCSYLYPYHFVPVSHVLIPLIPYLFIPVPYLNGELTGTGMDTGMGGMVSGMNRYGWNECRYEKVWVKVWVVQVQVFVGHMHGLGAGIT